MGYFKELDARIKLAQEAVADAIRVEGHTLVKTDLVGSTYITDKQDSDLDILCLVKSITDVDSMAFGGWAYGGSVGEGGDGGGGVWGSWKKHISGAGEVNMLVVTDESYFNAWLTSAEVCRYLHLRGIVVPRVDRVSIHNIIMDDASADLEVNSTTDCF